MMTRIRIMFFLSVRWNTAIANMAYNLWLVVGLCPGTMMKHLSPCSINPKSYTHKPMERSCLNLVLVTPGTHDWVGTQCPLRESNSLNTGMTHIWTHSLNQTWDQFHFANSNSAQFHLINSNSIKKFINSNSGIDHQFQFQNWTDSASAQLWNRSRSRQV